jgi:anti-anti-sigma factor
MDISFDSSSGTFILRVSGDMRLWSREEGSDRLVEVLRARRQLPKQLIFNLADVECIDSLGVGALVRVLVECTKQDIDLKIVMPRGPAIRVLELVHIFDGCATFADEAAAARAATG